jgi:uncharacterized membrane protein
VPALRLPRAKNVFLAAFGAALVLLVLAIAVSAVLRTRGPLDDADAKALLGVTRDVVLPLAFLGLGALLWHMVRFYRGDYARR